MPPSRRRPTPQPPTGRPRVAGLRRPSDGRTRPPAPPTPGEPAAPAVPAEAPDAARTESPQVAEVVPEPAAAAGDRATGDTATGDTAIGDTATGDAVPADVPDEPVAGVAVIGEDEPAGTDTDTDTADDDDEDDEDEPAEPAGTTPRRGSSLVLPVALLVVAVVLGGLGAFFFAQARGVRSSTAASNTALVDSARTSEVNGQVQDAVEKAFSYDFSDIVATEKAADEVLTGRARCQYGVVFEPVRTLAPEQKLVVTTKAVTSGVTVLDDDRATALVFVDQVTTRTTDNQTGGGVGMLRASAERVDGRWKITDLVMFGQTADQQGQMSQCQ